jgi:hypothetical protein
MIPCFATKNRFELLLRNFTKKCRVKKIKVLKSQYLIEAKGYFLDYYLAGHFFS